MGVCCRARVSSSTSRKRESSFKERRSLALKVGLDLLRIAGKHECCGRLGTIVQVTRLSYFKAIFFATFYAEHLWLKARAPRAQFSAQSRCILLHAL